MAETAAPRHERAIGDGPRFRTGRRRATGVSVGVRALDRVAEFGRTEFARAA